MHRISLKPMMVSLLAAGIATPPALAQEPAGSESEEDAVFIEEIVVTARRKEESLQDVPVSVTPIDVPELYQRGARGLEDIAQQTPGFSFEGFSTSGTNANAVIRGLSNTFTTARIQNVSFFLNGVYLQRQSMLNLSLVDIQRVEVVRGPQSALYGRNAFAGAVNYVSRRPSNEFDAYIQGVLGDNERQDLIVSLSGPLTDTLRGKVSFGVTEYDGHTDNNHPVKDANPPGPNTRGNLGGWEDSTWTAGIEWDITDDVMFGVSYYHSEFERELQPYYVIGGLLSERQGFISGENNDMNCNFAEVGALGAPTTLTGNTIWCGELPEAPDPDKRARAGINVDPRGVGADAETDLWTVNLDWNISDSIAMNYIYGYTDHSSFSNGGTGEEDTITGAPQLWQFVPPNVPPEFLPFPRLDYVWANQSSGRPVSTLESDSHELRFTFDGNETWSGQAGLYYSDVQDEETDFLWFMPVCSDIDVQGINSNGTNEDEIANCSLEIAQSTPSPYAGAPFVTTYDFGTRQHGIPLNHTKYRDKIWAVYGSVTWNINDAWSVTAEGRYEDEDKRIKRLTDAFGLAPGESAPIFPGGPPDFVTHVPSAIVVPEDEEDFSFFTPRFIAQYQATADRMWYFSAAKGVKTGGFNNTLSETQLTYEEEENWTYEFGTKHTLADGRLRLNGSVYWIDWTNIQGTTPVEDTGGSINSNNVVDNIGDAEGYGLELEGYWFINDNWSLDFGYAYNKIEFNDGVKYLAAVNFYQCDGIVCPEDGDVGGHRLPRTSEHQLNGGINWRTMVSDWSMDWRLDGAYQSKQFTDPLNVGWIPDRTTFNSALTFTSPEGHWDLTVWGRNLTDESYVSNAFVQAQFNRLLVGLGARRSWGVTAKYTF